MHVQTWDQTENTRFHCWLKVWIFWPQIELHTALEDKLPYWFVNRVDKNSITVYPNRKCSKVCSTLTNQIPYNISICLRRLRQVPFLILTTFCQQHYIKQLITGDDDESEVWTRLHAKSQKCSFLEDELKKQKRR